MIFTDLWFIPFFLAVFLITRYALRNKNDLKKLFITLSSYFFYATWSWKLSVLIFLSTTMDFFLGKFLSEAKTKSQAKFWLVMSVILNLGVLGFFKYFNFFIDNVNAIFGTGIIPWNIILPVGISFYTFQSMSYCIDIYYGKMKAEKKFLNFAFYVIFFPHLVAGPIVRASEFLPQTHRDYLASKKDIFEGLQIFFQGVFKKIVFANQFALFVDPVFANPSLYNTPTIWLAVIAYSLQIYYDFSGYSDMAIGIARMLGYNLVTNFDLPYLSKSVTEFWTRWHMSLSRWIRDYIYIPLGGNRKGKVRQYINLMITMLLGGLWHGASWNFVIWGGLHGLMLSFEKFFGLHKKTKKKSVNVLAWFVTMIFLMVTWVFFRAKTFDIAFIIIQKMFVFSPGVGWYYSYVLIFIPIIIFIHYFGSKVRKQGKEYFFLDLDTFVGLTLFAIMIILIFILNPQNPAPFIYFQF